MMNKEKYPEEWRIEKIQDIAFKPQYGYTASASEIPIGPKFLRITDIKDGKVDWKNVPHCNCDESTYEQFKLNKGDIVFARTGATTGKSYLIEKDTDSIFASYLIRLKAKDTVKPEYLSQVFLSDIYWRQINRVLVGSAQGGVNASVLSSLTIPVPPLVEQRGIVEVLGTVDECIRLTDAVIERAEELKRGLMQQLLTRGIGHTEYKETSLGTIPKKWKIKELGDVSQLFKQGGSDVHSEVYIGIENIESDTGRISYFEKQTEYATKKTFKKNTILFGRIRSYLNKKWLADVDGYCSTDIIVIEPQQIHGKLMLYHLLSQEFVNYSIRFSYGSQMPRIHWKDIKNYLIPFPPQNEQSVIVEIIEKLDKIIILNIDYKTKMKIIKQGLMQILLSGNIRVELKEDGLHRIRDSREAHH